MKQAQIYDFTIPANGSFQLNVEGDYIRIMASVGTVEIVTDGMRLGPLKAGQGQAKAPFKRVTLNDKSGAANSGSVLVASSDFVDQRVNGDVSVIDGGKNRTLSGVAFMGNITSQPVAAEFSRGQILNPAGSGKNIVIKTVYVSQANAGSFSLGLGQTAFTNLQGTPPANKRAGGPASVIQLREMTSALPLNAGNFFSGYVPASSSVVVQLAEPFLLPPGYAFHAASGVTATQIIMAVDYFEDPI